ncbi:hypothetical protein [Actinomadura sp. WMMA1423]|uniref:hypothetical protein n=1 Tax=Actinomadura sp. WMMA1423 TaxID=2591108 RepID=UPI0011473C8C|nr:hypothetical protein [Actinomadura sp. WMMA1423]
MSIFSRRSGKVEFTAEQLCAGGGAGPEWKAQVELGRAIVTEVREAEVPDFDAIVAEYRCDPVRAFGAGRLRAPVGMGVDVGLVTPYVLAIVSLLMNATAGSAATKVIEAALARARAARRVRGGAPEGTVIELDGAERRVLAELITDQGVALGLDPDQARMLATSVLHALLTDRGDEA